MAYRLYIVGRSMTPSEFESAKPDLPGGALGKSGHLPIRDSAMSFCMTLFATARAAGIVA
jgi:hypothetical protein